MTIGEIAALVLGSNGLWAVLTLIITRALNKKDKNSDEWQLQKNTIALLMYQAFSDKIERVLDKSNLYTGNADDAGTCLYNEKYFGE